MKTEKFEIEVHLDYTATVTVVAQSQEQAIKKAEQLAVNVPVKELKFKYLAGSSVKSSVPVKTEYFKFGGYEKAKELMTMYPTYRLMKCSGLWNSKFSETDEAGIKRLCDWACVSDVTIDHEAEEIRVHGFSENDMY